MSLSHPWWALAATLALVLAYEGWLVLGRGERSGAPALHASLREQWLAALAAHPGSEILAVQTLRNSLMSATMVASTAALGLIASATLAAPSLQELAASDGLPPFTPRLALELALMALLFASLLASVMAVRGFNHAGFIASMPVGSDARRRWSAAGVSTLRRAGLLYGWGLRQLLLVRRCSPPWCIRGPVRPARHSSCCCWPASIAATSCPTSPDGLMRRRWCAAYDARRMTPKPLRALLRIFATGALAALPLAATLLIFAWAGGVLIRWLGPDSLIGHAMISIGLGVGASEVVGYAIGVAIAAAAIFGLGLLVEARLQRGLEAGVEALVSRIPLVGTVYDLLKKMTALFSPREGLGEGPRSMSAVWCHFGGRGSGHGAALALLGSEVPVLVDGAPCLAVLVPTAPVPVGGGLLYVPQDWITPAGIGIEAVTSIYVSMGLTSPQHLPRADGVVLPRSG
jgi:uncharacterized membrane protein